MWVKSCHSSAQRPPSKGQSLSHAWQGQEGSSHQPSCAIMYLTSSSVPPHSLLDTPPVTAASVLSPKHPTQAPTPGLTPAVHSAWEPFPLPSLRHTFHLQVFAENSSSLNTLFKTATPLPSMTYPPLLLFLYYSYPLYLTI